MTVNGDAEFNETRVCVGTSTGRGHVAIIPTRLLPRCLSSKSYIYRTQQIDYSETEVPPRA